MESNNSNAHSWPCNSHYIKWPPEYSERPEYSEDVGILQAPRDFPSSLNISRTPKSSEYSDTGVGIGMLVGPREGWVGGWEKSLN